MKKLRIKTVSSLANHVGGIWYRDFPSDDEGGGGPCSISSCQTTCTGPTSAECCCFYSCPSGTTWVCKAGYCANTSRSCL